MREAIERVVAHLENCWRSEYDESVFFAKQGYLNLSQQHNEASKAYSYAIDRIKAVLANETNPKS